MPQAPKTLNTFEAINQLILDLRGPEGCPWDKEQTHKSLAPYAVEEASELAEAIESGNDAHICEELGDVLFQVVLHAAMAKERGAFDISDVIQGISEKLVRRHPHVFSDVKVSGPEQVIENWNEIKKKEKALNKSNKPKYAIEVPAGMPALQRAHKIGEKTNKLGFDWNEASQVLDQLKAEIVELEEVLFSQAQDKIEHEMGDILFSAAQLARHIDVEPETALRNTNRRFLGRFEKMLEIGNISAEQFKELPAATKEELWSKAKKALAAYSPKSRF